CLRHRQGRLPGFRMNNVELVVKMFEQAGIRWVFGVPSGPVLPLIEAIRNSQSVRYVLTASETSAGFMAEAVGRTTGVPGVCVSTVGPGATNLATGVGGAWLDRSPMLAITCNYDRHQLGRRTQMLIDHQALFAPLTKASFLVEEGKVAETFAKAMTIAMSEPPGPVHLDFPEDVGKAGATEAPLAPEPPTGAAPPPEDVGANVQRLLGGAKHPMVVTGLTFTRAKEREALVRFLDTQSIPFVATLHAKGFIPESHPGNLGVMGRARRTDVAKMLSKADLFVTIGFDPIEIDYEDWAGETPVVHLSTEPVQPNTRINLAYEAVGDLDAIMRQLAGLPAASNAWEQSEFAAHRDALNKALRPQSHGMAAHHVLDMLRARLPAGAIVAYDVGAHTHQIATQWTTDQPHTAIATNGWSSMGYGMPSAYAAKLAHPEREVVGVVGDGCFQMTVGELAMARRMGLKAPVVVLNDGWLGLMKVKQERLEFGSSGALLGEQVEPPSHYFGVPVRAVRDEKAFREALDWALSLDGPSVIEAFIDVEAYSQTVFD
ncbi:MAG: thiamine pyrophosphate-binding protein, partial [Dehalococcoidia bacterium]